MNNLGNAELIQAIFDLQNQLNAEIKMLDRYGRELAAAERDYKIRLRQEALTLRAEGIPVTLIDKIVYGVRDVADRRFKRDVAQTMYDTAQEKINGLKLQMRILDNQISREWGQQ